MRLSEARLFPLLLMLALALLTFVLERASRQESIHPSLRRHDPDYVIENFSITRYDQEGRAESTLAATKMIHFPDDDSTELLAPRVVQTKAGEPRMTLVADRGALSHDGEEIFLYDNVLLVREQSADLPEARVRTSFLHVVHERSLVRTDREVAIEEESRSLSGRGMEYYNESRQMFLRENVRGRFEPKKTQ